MYTNLEPRPKRNMKSHPFTRVSHSYVIGGSSNYCPIQPHRNSQEKKPHRSSTSRHVQTLSKHMCMGGMSTTPADPNLSTTMYHLSCYAARPTLRSHQTTRDVKIRPRTRRKDSRRCKERQPQNKKHHTWPEKSTPGHKRIY